MNLKEKWMRMEKGWEEIMDKYYIYTYDARNYMYIYTCSKCDFPVIWEIPYACSIWMLPCENCGYEYCYFESIDF